MAFEDSPMGCVLCRIAKSLERIAKVLEEREKPQDEQQEKR